MYRVTQLPAIVAKSSFRNNSQFLLRSLSGRMLSPRRGTRHVLALFQRPFGLRGMVLVSAPHTSKHHPSCRITSRPVWHTTARSVGVRKAEPQTNRIHGMGRKEMCLDLPVFSGKLPSKTVVPPLETSKSSYRKLIFHDSRGIVPIATKDEHHIDITESRPGIRQESFRPTTQCYRFSCCSGDLFSGGCPPSTHHTPHRYAVSNSLHPSRYCVSLCFLPQRCLRIVLLLKLFGKLPLSCSY